ncbi:MAG: LPS assembly protein LptD [Candidatus Desulfofervidaceae bacterium]|nr:LPS assembly protein LptD [Candidatus Desulfofervidaceae bacterium]
MLKKTWAELPPDISQLPVQITAQEITYNKAENVYEARGHVVIDQGERHIEADKVRVNLTTQKAFLKGHVLFKIGTDRIKAEEGEINLNTFQGVLYQAQVFIAQNHLYIRGDEIKKTGPQTYVIERAQITSCDGASPAWHFTAHRAKVTIEGKATASHVAFWAKSVPLLYVPYIILPAKTKRQTGFLFPFWAYSERDGTDVTLPFFWAIKPNMDATFYQRYMTHRGWMEGVEYRYLLNETDKGIIYFDYLNDKREDIDFIDDNLSRTNKKRWWWRSKQEHVLPGNIYAQLDIDLVSDQDYLREFTEGFNNYRHCNREFLRYFKRGLNTDETSLLRESTFSLTKNWTSYSLIGELHYTQNLDKTQDEYTFQRLPQVSFIRNDSPIFKNSLFLRWDTTYTNFWRPESTRGQRFHFAPTISLPYGNKYVELLPQLTLMETLYFTNDGDNDRFLYEASMEAKTNLWRSFSWPGHFIHHLEPRIVYTYRPDVEQGDLPSFDGLDRLYKKNQITYTLTNYFLTERDNRFHQVMRVSVSQTYDINEARRSLLPGQRRRPFSDVVLKAQLGPFWGIYLDTEGALSPYGEGITRGDADLNVTTKRGDRLRLTYQYRPEQTRDLGIELFAKLFPKWSIEAYNMRSFQYHQNIETRVSLQYQSQCWGVRFAYTDLYADRKFMIIFTLTGVGEIKGITFGGR